MSLETSTSYPRNLLISTSAGIKETEGLRYSEVLEVHDPDGVCSSRGLQQGCVREKRSKVLVSPRVHASRPPSFRIIAKIPRTSKCQNFPDIIDKQSAKNTTSYLRRIATDLKNWLAFHGVPCLKHLESSQPRDIGAGD